MLILASSFPRSRLPASVEFINKASMCDSSELFQKLSNGEKVFVEGVKDSIPGFSITFQDNEDMFIKEDKAMLLSI
jgi:hypothetical protein